MTSALRFAPLAILWAGTLCAPAATAETLQCRSVNGNVTCAGSGAVSCQRVDGRTTCVSGSGGIVQQFGGGAPGTDAQRADAAASRAAAEAIRQQRDAVRRLRIEQQGPAGSLSLEREGGRLRLRTDRTELDLDD